MNSSQNFGNRWQVYNWYEFETAYSTCRIFTRSKEGIQKFKETGYERYAYRDRLNKTCFQHDLQIIPGGQLLTM